MRSGGWFGEVMVMDKVATLLINTQKLWLPVLDNVNRNSSTGWVDNSLLRSYWQALAAR